MTSTSDSVIVKDQTISVVKVHDHVGLQHMISTMRNHFDRTNSERVVTISTEFNGIYVLSLVQIYFGNNIAYLVHVAHGELGLFGEHGRLEPLKDLLETEKIVKVFHSPYEDLIRLCTVTRARPQNIFDTQLGGAYYGYHRMLSYKDFIQDVWDENFPVRSKEIRRSTWSCYPLSRDQVRYAVLDVVPLYYAYFDLKNRLLAHKRNNIIAILDNYNDWWTVRALSMFKLRVYEVMQIPESCVDWVHRDMKQFESKEFLETGLIASFWFLDFLDYHYERC